MERCVFVLAGLAMLVAAMVMGGTLAAFVNAPSLVIVVGGGLLFTLGTHGVAAVVAALKAGCCGTCESATERRAHIHVLQTLRNQFCAMGGLGLLIGFIQMLQNLSDPKQIGPAMAVAMLCTLYAIFLAEVVTAPMVHRLAAQSDAAEREDSDEAGPGMHTGARGVVTLLAAYLSHTALMLSLMALVG